MRVVGAKAGGYVTLLTGGVMVIVGLAACSSSAKHGSTPADHDVITQVATYRQRGAAATDHVLDACHNAEVATGNPNVDPVSLPACSSGRVAAEIGVAGDAAATLSRQVASVRGGAITPAMIADTTRELDALATALRAWAHCAAALSTQAYFDGNPCRAKIAQADRARSGLIAEAHAWPES